ncbi:MAG: M1 family metallopeptidase [Rhodothermales bacterium]|nr:M1 family metallopeptidase [Rhodothermales bacterium]
MQKHLLLLAFLSSVLLTLDASAQFTRQDTLRGSITPERAWWDLTYYHLDVAVDPASQTLAGLNTVHYRVLAPGQRLQIDLQPPMRIEAVEQAGTPLAFERDGNVYYIDLTNPQTVGADHNLSIRFAGAPKVAVRPPWDGGLSWKQDTNGKPFVASSNQGIGASIWWPNKDHMYDEPDSMLISLTVPDFLVGVANGRLRQVDAPRNGTQTYHWFVDNPINNYGVNVNVGDYAHWTETYAGEKGDLSLDYYVLRENLDKAKAQFAQVPGMLDAFEHWFGPYPFYEDGFKLVEVPYLGMEHQSSVTYGNMYQNGYLGNDLSGTGWGLKFDFIIIHESGHEWFANNITYKDVADMWVHEGFTAYSENLYVDYHFGKEASADYVIGTRDRIQNDRPIIGPYGVNKSGSGDMYYKGANLLHTVRALVGDDARWRAILRGLNEAFYHQTVTTQQIEQYIIDQSGIDLRPVFDQYLRDSRIPTLAYRWEDGNTLAYRWTEVIEGFDMTVELTVAGQAYRVQPSTDWQTLETLSRGEVVVDRDYYIVERNLTE